MLDRFAEYLVDRRAFAGALSILLVGLQLTVMMAFYFIPGGEAFALLQSRWWWEITLNLQILCLALMWLCHSERIAEAAGWRKTRAIVRLIVGLAGVSTPFWTLVVCAANDWFHHPPSTAFLLHFGTIIFVIWLTIAYAIPLLVQLFMKRGHFIYMAFGGSGRRVVVTFSPFILLGFLWVEEALRGGTLHYVLWPLMTYIHCAIPFLYRAFTPVTAEEAARQAFAHAPSPFRQ